MSETDAGFIEARRVMEVCNACRYCEGYCAVFPAMELRRDFADADLTYLANLCHGCKGCYYACQYAPPHEFGINVPRALADVREDSYVRYAWPAPMAALFDRHGRLTAIATAAGITAVLLLTMLLNPQVFAPQPVVPGQGFYKVIPYAVIVLLASASFAFSLVALAIGFARFWRETGGRAGELTRLRPLRQALGDAASLRYLGGGGAGCNAQDEQFSTRRRTLHHLMAYGFLACLASTSTATVYHHLLGWRAPYDVLSLPVILGVVGGLAMVAGTAGLLWLKASRDREPLGGRAQGADSALLLLLLLIAVTGLLLLAARATGAMGVLLAVHFGLVLAFFVTMPYSHFVHGLYRTGALIRHAVERPTASHR